jgi:nucleotide-binding universal stress UspA family protein
MYRRILLATDGSELADRASTHALELAKALGAKLTVVTVTEMFPNGPYSPIPWPADIERYEAAAALSAEKILDRVRETARSLGVACAARHVATQPAAEGILMACRDYGCDLIVMASHGRSGLSRFMLGSQANKVVTLSTVPVLMRRPCATPKSPKWASSWDSTWKMRMASLRSVLPPISRSSLPFGKKQP